MKTFSPALPTPATASWRLSLQTRNNKTDNNKSYSRNRPLPRALPVPRVVVGEGEDPVRGQPRPELLVPAGVLAEAVGEEHQALHVDVLRVSLLGPRGPPVPAEDPAVAAVRDRHGLRVADHAAERKIAPFRTKWFFL